MQWTAYDARSILLLGSKKGIAAASELVTADLLR
jgi:hypothetical protein